jgi:hypothetical protein
LTPKTYPEAGPLLRGAWKETPRGNAGEVDPEADPKQ